MILIKKVLIPKKKQSVIIKNLLTSVSVTLPNRAEAESVQKKDGHKARTFRPPARFQD